MTVNRLRFPLIQPAAKRIARCESPLIDEKEMLEPLPSVWLSTASSICSTRAGAVDIRSSRFGKVAKHSDGNHPKVAGQMCMVHGADDQEGRQLRRGRACDSLARLIRLSKKLAGASHYREPAERKLEKTPFEKPL
jgi:hypothetical protein